MANGRGNWNVDAGIAAKWTAAALDAQFKAGWSDPTTTQYLALNDGEARPAKGAHPRPYCVFEIDRPIKLGHSTGKTPDTERHYQDVPVQFTIYADSKLQAKQFAVLVATVFDKGLLTLDDDQHIDTLIDGDFGVRLDDRSWSRTLQYRIRIDCTYSLQLS